MKKHQTEAGKPLSAAAKRAIQEAQIRRKASKNPQSGKPVEINGREGPDPTRFGDWEKNGIISDF